MMSALSLLQSSPAFLVVSCVLIGLCMGSFLNVVIHRMPKMMEARWRAECAELNASEGAIATATAERYNLVLPRSACPACGHQISALQNIPIVSYLALR